MKLKRIVGFLLAIAIMGCGAELQAQKKSSSNKKTTATKTATQQKSYPPLSQAELNKKTLVLSQDMGDGDVVKISILLDFNDLSIWMGGAEYEATASISGNTLTLKSGALLFTLTSKDGGFYFTGTLKNMRKNTSFSLEGYIFDPDAAPLNQEMCKAFAKGEYEAFIDVAYSRTRPDFFFPVTITFTPDPSDPTLLSYKIKGNNKYLSLLGPLKGDLKFTTDKLELTDEGIYTEAYSTINSKSFLLPLEPVKIPGIGKANVFLYLYKKN